MTQSSLTLPPRKTNSARPYEIALIHFRVCVKSVICPGWSKSMRGARMPLDRLVIYHLPTPLARPYRLSFRDVDHFDSFIAMACFADGSVRVGESTPLPGYSHETAELLCREYGMLARHGLIKQFLDRNRAHPFVIAPVLTCLDPTLSRTVEGAVKLCPILQWNELSEIAENLAKLVDQGNDVVKVKITADVE